MADVKSLVQQCVADGIITAEQGEQILARHQATPRGPVVTEALAYIGGMLVVLAVITIASIYWPSLSTTERSALTGGAAALTLGAGFLVPSGLGATTVRLRAVLWALAVALTGVWIGVTLDGRVADETGILIAASGSAVLALVLWLRQRTFLQQLALGVSLVVAGAVATEQLDGHSETLIGLSTWGLGLAWLLIAWGGLMTPQRAAYLLGGAAFVVGALFTGDETWGLWFAVGTVAVLVMAAVLLRDLWLLGVGSIGVLITVPLVVDKYFYGQLAAALALLAAGGVMIAIGVFVARRPASNGGKAISGSPIVASALAALTIAATTAAILYIGRS